MAALLSAACEELPLNPNDTSQGSAPFSNPFILGAGAVSVDDSILVAAYVHDSQNQVVSRPTQWSTSDTTIATVNAKGWVRGRKLGSVTLRAVVEGLSTERPIVVESPYKAFVSPDTNVLIPGLQRALTLETFSTTTGLDTLTGTWSSSNAAVASVDATGLVTAHAAGVADITATIGGYDFMAKVYVRTFDAPQKFNDVSVVPNGACALTESGSTYCWGDVALAATLPTDRCATVFSYNIREVLYWSRSTHRCSGIPTLIETQPKLARLIPGSLWGLADDSTVVTPAIPFTPLGATGHKWAELSIQFHRCGIKGDGRAYCWNGNTRGQLGNGKTQPEGPWSQEPLGVVGDRRWSAILPTQHSSTCGLTTVGEAFCWGFNLYNQLGIGPECSTTLCADDVPEPRRVLTDERFVALASAGGDSCALTADGRTVCWGMRTPDMPVSDRGAPALVQGAPVFATLAVDASASGFSYPFFGQTELLTAVYAVDKSGSVFRLRRNQTATTAATLHSFVSANIPIAVKTFRRAPTHTCAISASDGKLYCWGAPIALGIGRVSGPAVSMPTAVVGQSP